MRTWTILLLFGLSLSLGCAATRHGACPGEPIICPNCEAHCELKVEKVKEEKECYDVECKAICIPEVRLPWEPCNAPIRCAKTRLVHQLVTKDYECERCQYSWTPNCTEGSAAPCASCY